MAEAIDLEGIDPCGQLNDKLDSMVSTLEVLGDDLLSYVTSVKDSIDAIEDYSSTEELAEEFETWTEENIRAGDQLVTEATAFAGSCFDFLIDASEKYIRGLADAILDLMATTTIVEKTISQLLAALKKAIGAVGIPDLVSAIDRVLGCLADNPDLIKCKNEIQDATDRVNAVIYSLYLDDSGAFDIDLLLDDCNADAQTKANVKAINSKFDSLDASTTNKIRNLTSTIKAKFNLNSNYY